MSDDRFWKVARRRVAHYLATTIRLAGFEVNAISMMEALRGSPCDPEHYLWHCLQSADNRKKAGQLTCRDTQLLHECNEFWGREFPDLAPVTRTPIVFELMARLEQEAYGYQLPDFLDPHDPENWDFF